jgi:hypothetical protein
MAVSLAWPPAYGRWHDAGMPAIPSLILTAVTERFSLLRFPTLFLLLVGLFLFDLFIPDFIPIVDELLLGIATLIVANLTRRRDGKHARDENAGR